MVKNITAKYFAWLVTFITLPMLLIGDEETIEFEVAGQQRKYLLYASMTKKPKRARPLVICLHGTGSSAEKAMQNYGWVSKAKEASFIVAFPQALPLHLELPADIRTNPTLWNDGSVWGQRRRNDIVFLKKVVEDISKRYRVDSKRIFFTGFSSGASMAFRVGIELSDRIAAVAPVSGYLWLEHPHPKRPMSALLITGANDPINPLEGGVVKSPWSSNGEFKPPMIDSIKTWAKLLRFDESHRTVENVNGVKTIQYGPDCDELMATLMIVANQGHEWPGGTRILPKKISGSNQHFFNATDTIWDFFKTQRLIDNEIN